MFQYIFVAQWAELLYWSWKAPLQSSRDDQLVLIIQRF